VVAGLVLQPADFHLYWHWDRYTAISLPILEPLRVISRLSTTTTTRRLPSGFEATETRERLCSQCKLPAHTRASRRCIVNIRREIAEIAPNTGPQFDPTLLAS